MESSFVGLDWGSSWQQLMVQNAWRFGQWVRLIVLLGLGTFMSRKQFKAILKALAITARQPPTFSDHFWEVREIIDAWKANKTEQFNQAASGAEVST